jgi:hypothetical protein
MIIWKTVPVLFKDKITHVKKVCGKTYHSFIVDFGDVPVARINEITGMVEDVVNSRGYAYAARKRMKYRKKD